MKKYISKSLMSREQQAAEMLDNALQNKSITQGSDFEYILIAYSKKGGVNQVTAYGSQQNLKQLFKKAKKRIIR